jgi:hypothetical protein
MPLYIPEPIFELSSQLQRNARRTMGVKPNGGRRSKRIENDLGALVNVVRHGRDTLFTYLSRGNPISNSDIDIAKDRLGMYMHFRSMMMDRIKRNRNHVQYGRFRNPKPLNTSTYSHLAGNSFQIRALDKSLKEMSSMVASMPKRQINQQAPSPPRGKPRLSPRTSRSKPRGTGRGGGPRGGMRVAAPMMR